MAMADDKVKETVKDAELKEKIETAGAKAKEVAKDLGGKVGDALDDARDYFIKFPKKSVTTFKEKIASNEYVQKAPEPYEEKRKFLKREEINIRQSIGEAVPTEIFHQIALNLKINQLH